MEGAFKNYMPTIPHRIEMGTPTDRKPAKRLATVCGAQREVAVESRSFSSQVVR